MNGLYDKSYTIVFFSIDRNGEICQRVRNWLYVSIHTPVIAVLNRLIATMVILIDKTHMLKRAEHYCLITL